MRTEIAKSANTIRIMEQKWLYYYDRNYANCWWSLLKVVLINPVRWHGERAIHLTFKQIINQQMWIFITNIRLLIPLSSYDAQTNSKSWLLHFDQFGTDQQIRRNHPDLNLFAKIRTISKLKRILEKYKVKGKSKKNLRAGRTPVGRRSHPNSIRPRRMPCKGSYAMRVGASVYLAAEVLVLAGNTRKPASSLAVDHLQRQRVEQTSLWRHHRSMRCTTSVLLPKKTDTSQATSISLNQTLFRATTFSVGKKVVSCEHEYISITVLDAAYFNIQK